MLAKGEKVYCKVISVEVGYLRVENYRSHDLNDLFKTKTKKATLVSYYFIRSTGQLLLH